MSDDSTQPGVRIDASVWNQFRQDVRDRHGTVRGHLGSEVERALKAYLDASTGGDTNDRLTNIEQELKEVRTLLESEQEKKKDSDISSTTEQRLDAIRDTIEKESDDSPKVHEQVVELAIRENAGGSDPTIRRYKQLLQNDRDLFPHAGNDSLYFRDATDFVTATNAMRKGGKIDADEYGKMLNEYSEDWWRDKLPDENSDGGRAFR